MRVIAALAMLAVFALGASGAFAKVGKGSPWQPYVLSGGSLIAGSIVKQQSDDPACYDDDSCVYNPTSNPRCIWDIDDKASYSGSGYLTAGTHSVTHCAFWDTAHHLIGVSLRSPASDLDVSVSYEPSGFVVTIAPVFVEGLWEYRGCVVGPLYNTHDPAIGPVPDSNGGWAASGSFTFGINSLTDHDKRDTSYGGVLLGSSEPSRQRTYCIGDFVIVSTSDGAVFRVAVP